MRTVEEVTTVRFAVIGDVHGSFRQAAKAIAKAKRRVGELDAVLGVGDLEANRHARDAAGVATGKGHRRWVGEFPQVLRGAIDLGAPLWFIGGDHEPWAALDARGPGELAPGVSFLGRAGVRDVAGLKVAYLSGVYGDASGGDMFNRHGRDERACYVRAEITALERSAERAGAVDVFVTHDWPADLLGEDGDAELARLSRVIGAPLHVCGHRHRAAAASDGDRLVVALADIGVAGGWAAFERAEDGTITRLA